MIRGKRKIVKAAPPEKWELPIVPKEDTIDKRCANLLKQAAAITSITSEDHFIAAGALIPRLDEAWKWIDSVSDPFVRAMHALHKKALGFRDRKLEPIEHHKSRLLAMRMTWRSKKEAEQRERDQAEAERQQKKAKEELRAAAKEAQKAGDTQAAEVYREQAKAAPMPIIHSEPAVPDQAGMYVRERWVFTIVKPEDVQREYCEPSPALIRKVVESLGPACGVKGIVVTREVKEHSRAVPA